MPSARTDAAAFATLPGAAVARVLGTTAASIVPASVAVAGLVAAQLVIGLLALILISR